MKSSEFSHIIAAILILTLVFGFAPILKLELEKLPMIFAFAVIILLVSILAKKITAYLLDADVEHEIWTMSRYGLKQYQHLKKPLLAGVIFPVIIALISLGAIKFSGILTYEARALKHRAAKRFGIYSYTEMTDWHNGLIGASGVFFLLLLAIITYFIPDSNLEYLSKMTIYYNFWNLIPFSKLDGTQIFFGSRILWTILATITTILAFFALTILP